MCVVLRLTIDVPSALDLSSLLIFVYLQKDKIQKAYIFQLGWRLAGPELQPRI